MRDWQEVIIQCGLLLCCILSATFSVAAEQEADVSFRISNIEAAITSDSLQYIIKGGETPIYTVTRRFAPFRVVLDIAGGQWSDGVTEASAKIPANPFVSLQIEDLASQLPKIKRFVFQLAESHDYLVEKIDDGIRIDISPKAEETETGTVGGENESSSVNLQDLVVKSTPNSTTISIISDQGIKNYTVDTLAQSGGSPPRMYIDIENVVINQLVREKQIGTSVARVRVAPRGDGARIVFDSAADTLFVYTVVPTPSGLDIVVDETARQTGNPNQQSAVEPSAGADEDTLDQLIASAEELAKEDPDVIASRAAEERAASLEDDFSFSGYTKERISVDFYKIDIHNVFRLFKELTDLNIIIDEDVKGSLTLALNDVPWDFALDIILNLMDLKKEERFNTIVIYPSKKEFAWPTRAEDNLTIEADIEVIEEEALIVERTENLSKEVLKAKELIVKAQKLEKSEDYEDAVALYEEALEYWPENSKISGRLASLHLVNLRGNAKAVYFAKKALALEPDNSNDALVAAIGLANMQRLAEANEYFLQSVSGTPPMKEALLSYAAFSENNGENSAALKLLEKYNSNYGESLNTMVSRARILDKLGRSSEANQQYLAILASGFQLRPDLKQFIEGRLSAGKIQ